MAASASQMGRDIVFRLRVQTDPNEFKGLQKFADDVVKTQKKIDDNADKLAKAKERKEERDKQAWLRMQQRYDAMEASAHVKSQRKAVEDVAKAKKKAGDEDVRLSLAREAIIARDYLRTHLKAIDDRKRAEMKAAQETAQWRANLIRNSALLEQRENVRLSREQAAMALRNNQVGRVSGLRRAQGVSRIGQGVLQLGEAAAYSGMIGENNTQRMLNTLFAIQTAKTTVDAGRNIYNGIKGGGIAAGLGGMFTGLSGGAPGVTGGTGGLIAVGGLASTAAAALAALAGALLGGNSAIGFAGDVQKYGFGRGSSPGSQNDVVGSKLASTVRGPWNVAAFGLAGLAGRLLLGPGPKDTSLDANPRFATGMISGEDRDKRIMESLVRLSGLDSNSRTLKQSYSALNESIGVYKGTAGASDDIRSVAAARVRDIEQEILHKQREQHRTALDAARDRLQAEKSVLDTARDLHRERTQSAADARRDLAGDIYKFATAKPSEQSAVRQIAQKRAAGIGLSRKELELAGEYEEFRPFAQSNAERLANQAGAGFVFSEGLSRQRDTQQAVTQAAAEVSRAELAVKNRHEVIVKMEADQSPEQVLNEEFKQVAAEIAKADAMMRDFLVNEMRTLMQNMLNSRKPR